METFFAVVILVWIFASLGNSSKKRSNNNYRRHNKDIYNDDTIESDKDNEISSIDSIKNKETYEKRYSSKEVTNRSIGEEQTWQLDKSKIVTVFFNFGVNCLWHLTHRDNIDNILEGGLLSYSKSHGLGLNIMDISDPGAQRWRERTDNPHLRKIHNFVPFYINPRNPMLYVRRNMQNELCLMEISLAALDGNQYLITDGNAASKNTLFFDSVDKLNQLPWEVLRAKYWNDFPDGKRKCCAEVLIYPKVPAKMIQRIHCCSRETLGYISGRGIEAQISPKYFF